MIDITIPVYNEEAVLEKSIAKLRKFLKSYNKKCRIIIANNSSTDKTLEIAKNLAKKYQGVSYIHLGKKGRGRALKKSWLNSKAGIVSYMDVDLSTGLDAFPKMIASIESGFDIAIGSRFAKGAKVKRSLKREILSRAYNLMLKPVFFNRFSDSQCGFKAASSKTIKKVAPKVKNNQWFFDTEFLIRAEKKGYKIKEVPVRWKEDPGTKVKTAETVMSYLYNIIRLRINLFVEK